MDYDQFSAAVAPVGAKVVGLAAAIIPPEDGDAPDGFAVAVMIPVNPPIWFVTQFGSAPRKDVEALRRVMRESMAHSQKAPRSPLHRFARALARLFK